MIKDYMEAGLYKQSLDGKGVLGIFERYGFMKVSIRLSGFVLYAIDKGTMGTELYYQANGLTPKRKMMQK